MGPTQGHYTYYNYLHGSSHFWRGLTPPDPPLFRTLLDGLTEWTTRKTSYKESTSGRYFWHCPTTEKCFP